METFAVESILDKVIRASRDRKINWIKNTKAENSFKAELGTNTIHVLLLRTDYYFIIVNEEGDQIGNLEGFQYAYKLEELYQLAKRKALNIDDNLDEINSILDKII